MSGDPYITCSTGVWSTLQATCTIQDLNRLTTNFTENNDGKHAGGL